MSRLYRHLRLVWSNGKRVGDPPLSDRDVKRAELLARARARQDRKRNRR
jgi:hypothetical protein